MASRVPAGLSLPKMRSVSTPPGFSETPRPAARRRGEPALTPIGFGAPGLPETFLRNGEGRTTQTAGQRKERHCMEQMPQRSLRSSRIRACEAIRLCCTARLLRRSSIPSSKSTGNSASDFASTSTPARWNDSSSRRGTKSTEQSRAWSPSAANRSLGKKARFYRVVFENRFKHRNT